LPVGKEPSDKDLGREMSPPHPPTVQPLGTHFTDWATSAPLYEIDAKNAAFTGGGGNIKIYLTEIQRQDVNSIQPVLDRGQWRIFVKAVMNLRVPYK
jgi:hypothetical protein